MTKPREVVLALPRRALKIIAAKWFLRGFALSGRGFHGECLPPGHDSVRTLLLAEFEKLWGADDREHNRTESR